MSKFKRKTSKHHFGNLKDGREAHIYRLTNPNGLEAEITNFGGILVSLKVPDANQDIDDIVLGYDTLDEYVADKNYFGCTVGRYANRIADATITIDGTTHQLTKNDGPNHLHGGHQGFNKRLWIPHTTRDTLQLTYTSPHGEEG